MITYSPVLLTTIWVLLVQTTTGGRFLAGLEDYEDEEGRRRDEKGEEGRRRKGKEEEGRRRK